MTKYIKIFYIIIRTIKYIIFVNISLKHIKQTYNYNKKEIKLSI